MVVPPGESLPVNEFSAINYLELEVDIKPYIKSCKTHLKLMDFFEQTEPLPILFCNDEMEFQLELRAWPVSPFERRLVLYSPIAVINRTQLKLAF